MYKLSVCIPCRDRTILTQKCIDSIWINSNSFNKIDIYIFDNLSEVTYDRIELFHRMLDNRKICYYSYDTITSTHECFGKASIFLRWCMMMEVDHKLRDYVDNEENSYEQYFLLLDNDFVLCPKWDEYFISASKTMFNKEKFLHYLVPYPGGIPDKYRGPEKAVYTVENCFNNLEKFKVKMASGGGSSGFWFTNFRNLMRLKWNIETLGKVYHLSKRQDTETWNLIRKRCGEVEYVGAIKAKNDIPLALHLGKGYSICNRLHENTYEDNRGRVQQFDNIFKDLTVSEIIEQYWENCRWW